MLCVATREGFSCTLEQHEGAHEAWGEEDLCATWGDEGELCIHPEGETVTPGRLGDYIDAVLAPKQAEAASETETAVTETAVTDAPVTATASTETPVTETAVNETAAAALV